ncbi:histidine kinase [Streptomyces sp. NPDC048606]|uniref:sensor histidine kinase n=1 Tax=Streptomyces sp. NPDC048606 TaxID=3154726 RepID=UPI00342F1A59
MAPAAAARTAACPTESWSPRALDILLAGGSLISAWVLALELSGHVVLELVSAVMGSVAALALLFRRRRPVLVFVFTFLVMTVAVEETPFPTLAALFTLAERRYSRWALGGYVALYAVLTNLPDYDGVDEQVLSLINTVSSALSACAVVFLARLLEARRGLTRSLAELREAQEHQRELHAQAVLARERAQLAREMHDVVSHQVSLIAVCAGSLQVGADNEATREAARTIRRLSVTTLDELRHMVALLRAAGSRDRELDRRPIPEELPDLVAGSGLEARLVGAVPGDASAAVRRAVYRTVQEALTNARKHAPGASAVVEIRPLGVGLEVSVVNTVATRPGLRLPGSGHGLIGLRERMENLDGALVSGPTPDGGYRVHAVLPDRRH